MLKAGFLREHPCKSTNQLFFTMALLSATGIKQSIEITSFHPTLQHHRIYLNYQSGPFPRAALQQPEAAADFLINPNSWICSVGSRGLSSARLPKHWDAAPYRKWYAKAGNSEIFIRRGVCTLFYVLIFSPNGSSITGHSHPLWDLLRSLRR